MRVFWSVAEEKAVAQEHISQFPGHYPTWSKIAKSQLILPEERRKIGPPSPSYTKRFRSFILSLQGLPPDGGIKGPIAKPLNGHKVEAKPVAEPVPVAEPITEPIDEPAEPIAAAPAPVRSEPESSTLNDKLIALNRLVLDLQLMTLLDVKHATKDDMEAGRLRNLLIQAENGLTYFEQTFSKAI